MSKRKKVLVLGLSFFALSGLGLLFWYLGLFSRVDVVSHADNRMRAWAKAEFEGEQEEVENSPQASEGIEKNWARKIKLQHNLNSVDELLRPCPASDGWKGTNRKLLDLTGCKKGAGFRLALVDDSQGEVYEASLFFYGRDGQGKTDKKVLVPSGEAPVITAFPVGKGNLAFRISPPDVTSPVGYQLRGRVKFTYEGNADVLELVRK